MDALKILGHVARIALAVVLTPVGIVLGMLAPVTNSVLALVTFVGFAVCGVFIYRGQPAEAVHFAIMGGAASVALFAHIKVLDYLAPYWRDTPRVRVEHHDHFN